ncbi:MAG: AP2/ERF family transcription factor [Sedimentisphaerales bacterium]|nr:AP2/ERF family transcription factor [Sedimentisphaerales bacterium]
MDPIEFFRLGKQKWYAVKGGSTFYAVRGFLDKDGKRYRIHMHREVLKVNDNILIDHINQNGLDNRGVNLRPATCAQNMRNRKKYHHNSHSKYKGVYWQEHNKKWRVRIAANKKRIQLGQFSNEIEAAKAYDRAAKKYHGQFASLNFPHKKQPKTTQKQV